MNYIISDSLNWCTFASSFPGEVENNQAMNEKQIKKKHTALANSLGNYLSNVAILGRYN